MIDGYFCRQAERAGEDSTDNYNPGLAIAGLHVLNPDAPKLTVVFPPWHGGGPALERLQRRLARNGSAVAAFTFHDRLLEPNAERVLRSYDTVQSVGAAHIRGLRERHPYKSVRLLGLSLGTVSLALIANAVPDFDSAQIVVGSSNLALSMWDGNRTKGVRQGFEASKMTREGLDEAWRSLAPKQYAGSFADKPVSMVVSTRDAIVPTSYQEELADALGAAGANVHISRTGLGHYAAAARYCLVGK